MPYLLISRCKRFMQVVINLYLLSVIFSTVNAQPVSDGYIVHTIDGKIKKIQKINTIYLVRQNDRATTIAIEKNGEIVKLRVVESVKVLNQWFGFPTIDYGYVANPQAFKALYLEEGSFAPMHINCPKSQYNEIWGYLDKYPKEFGKRNARLILQNANGEIIAAPVVSKREVPKLKNIIKENNIKYGHQLSAVAYQLILAMEKHGIKKMFQQAILRSQNSSKSPTNGGIEFSPTEQALHQMIMQAIHEGEIFKNGYSVPPTEEILLLNWERLQKMTNYKNLIIKSIETRLTRSIVRNNSRLVR